MNSEYIYVQIGGKYYTVDCTFQEKPSHCPRVSGTCAAEMYKATPFPPFPETREKFHPSHPHDMTWHVQTRKGELDSTASGIVREIDWMRENTFLGVSWFLGNRAFCQWHPTALASDRHACTRCNGCGPHREHPERSSAVNTHPSHWIRSEGPWWECHLVTSHAACGLCPHSEREGVWDPGREGPAEWCVWWLGEFVTRDSLPSCERKRWYVKWARQQVRRAGSGDGILCPAVSVFGEQPSWGRFQTLF